MIDKYSSMAHSCPAIDSRPLKMPKFSHSLCYLLVASLSCLAGAENSTFNNPILPGFHPDPSCIFVPEWDDTFFCASSSFNAFPGIPIHASKDLQNWKLIGMLYVPNTPFGCLPWHTADCFSTCSEQGGTAPRAGLHEQVYGVCSKTVA